MARIVVSEFVSLDGVMEAPGGEPGYPHTGWMLRFPDAGQFGYKLEEVMSHEAQLVGRVTYESFVGAWPRRSGVFADRMNSMPKYVASNTMAKADWNNTTVLKGDVMAEVARLKQDLQGDILVPGSHTLVQGLRQAGLVDEYRLMVFPIVLGSGRRLFGETPDATSLKLTGTRTYENGIVVLTYKVVSGSEEQKDSEREILRRLQEPLRNASQP